MSTLESVTPDSTDYDCPHPLVALCRGILWITRLAPFGLPYWLGDGVLVRRDFPHHPTVLGGRSDEADVPVGPQGSHFHADSQWHYHHGRRRFHFVWLDCGVVGVSNLGTSRTTIGGSQSPTHPFANGYFVDWHPQRWLDCGDLLPEQSLLADLISDAWAIASATVIDCQ